MNNKLSLIWMAAIVLLFGIVVGIQKFQNSKSSKPNVVLFLADDMGIGRFKHSIEGIDLKKLMDEEVLQAIQT